MGINFQYPFYLLLLIPALFVVGQWWYRQNMSRLKRNVIAVLRSCLFLLLIFALAGAEWVSPVQAETVVFVVDRSASVKADEEIMTFLRRAVELKRPIDQFAIVSVGQQAGVEQPLTTKAEITPLGIDVGPHATNLAEGIRLAAGMIPSSARGKIVLLTDGLATHGQTMSELSLLKQRGISLAVVGLAQQLEEEVAISAVHVPNQLYRGEEFSIAVTLDSTVATKATVRVYEGNREAGVQEVAVEKGSNRYLLPAKANREGFHRYRVEIEAERDTIQVNNQGHAFTQVQGTPAVLLVEGTAGAGQNLANALRAANIQVEVKEPALLPQQLDDYKRYGAIILANVQALQMRTQDMERIRTAVADLGIGLIMTGGADSFGMGGWFKTPIEEALPVYMDLRGKEELPSLGLVLVIDKSGSMSGTGSGADKMELAKEAAIRSTEMLQESDQIGVIAFDGEPWVVVEPQPVTDLSSIQGQIGRIAADGGTDIFPALQIAYERMKDLKTQRKHIILLTDGQSGRADDYRGLLQQMTEEKITVSTVAVGSDADTALLEMIAEAGKGRFYYVTDPGSIPQIFSKETALASRTFIVEKPQVPIRTSIGNWNTLQQPVPPIHAYVATTAKQTAERILSSQDDDPLLARWQYGLGRAVAWTSDVEGKWAPLWAAWTEHGALWNEIVNWTFPQLGDGQWKTETEWAAGEGRISVTLPAGAAMPQQMEAVIVDDQLEREHITLIPVAPGVLQGSFTASDPGTYMIQILNKQKEQVVSSQTAGLTIAYSPEYRIRQDAQERIQELVTAGEGELLTEAAEVFTNQLPQKWERQSIEQWLLIMSLLLLPVEIAVRRLQWPDRWQLRFSSDRERTAKSTAATAAKQQVSKANESTVVDAEPDQQQPPARESQPRSRQASSPASRETDADPFDRLLQAKKRGQK